MIYKIPLCPLPDVRKTGRIRYPNGWFGSYRHKRNILIFVCSGEFIYSFSPEHKVKLAPGSHLLIPADVPYTATVGEDCDYFFIQFKTAEEIQAVPDKDVVEILKEETVAQQRAHSRDYDTEPSRYIYISETGVHKDRLETLKYRISRCAEFRQGRSPLDRMRLLHSFFRALLSLAAATGEGLLDTKHLSPAFIKLTRFIEENYTSPITLQSISEHFSLSKQYIMKLFREQAGVTVTHYINEIRLQKALDLLIYHSLSVSEVAYAVGFSNLYYFDRLFKKTYLITPTQFQKTHHLPEI